VGHRRAQLWVALVFVGLVVGSGSGPVADARPDGRLAVGPDGGAGSVTSQAVGTGTAAVSPESSLTEAAPTASPIASPNANTKPGPEPTAKPVAAPTPRATPKPAAPPAPPAPPPPLSDCPILPATNVWNRRVDGLPVAANSATMVEAIGLSARLHPDFGSYGGYGIPYNIVGSATPRTTVRFQYASESDRVGYPIPAHPRIEGGSDRHILMVDTNACRLYELYAAVKTTSGWRAGSGATWDLRSNKLRPNGWTSADAAGLPILPGLVRYAEVARGAIPHAVRFTAPDTCDGHIYPARHDAGSGSCAVNPPMGLRVRLKASVAIGGFGSQARVLLTALKRYGMILADNGSPWYVTGAPDPHWNDDALHALGQLTGDDFEVVNTSGFLNG